MRNDDSNRNGRRNNSDSGNMMWGQDPERNRSGRQGRFHEEAYNSHNDDPSMDQMEDTKENGQSYRMDDIGRRGAQGARHGNHEQNQSWQNRDQGNKGYSEDREGRSTWYQQDRDGSMHNNFSNSGSQDRMHRREEQSQYQADSDWNKVGRESGFGQSNQQDQSYGQQYGRPHASTRDMSSRNGYNNSRGADQGSYGQNTNSDSRYQASENRGINDRNMQRSMDRSENEGMGQGHNYQVNDAQKSIYGSAGFGSLNTGSNALNARSSMNNSQNNESWMNNSKHNEGSRSPSQGYGSGYSSRDESGYQPGYQGDSSRYGSSQGSSQSSRSMESNPGKQTPASYSGKGPKSFKRSDERIREEVSEEFTRHHEVDASDIEVQVSEGEVTLTGFVPERRMKFIAEDLAEKCMGVKDVTNNLRVKKENSLMDSSSGSEIERADKKSGSTTNVSGKKGSLTNPLNPNH